MSTLKADAVTAQSTNQDLDLSGNGTGVPDIATGFKVGGTAGLPINNLRVGTDGELITWDASGDPAAVAVGTATHILTSNGVGAAPTFQAAAGGGAWSVLTSGTFSAASTLDITGITKTTKFIVTTTAVSATGPRIILNTSSDGGASYDNGAANYNYRGILANSNTSALTMQRGYTGQNDFYVVPDAVDTTTGAASFEVTLYDPQLASPTQMIWQASWDDHYSAYVYWGTGGGARLAATDVDAVRLSPTSGTFTGVYVVLELN